MAEATTIDVAQELARDLQAQGARAVQQVKLERWGALLDTLAEASKTTRALEQAAETARRARTEVA